MAKAVLTEGTTKSNIKTQTTTKKPAAPPAVKKEVTTETVAAPVKNTRAKKVTPVVSALFEEPAPTKKVVEKKVATTPAPLKKVAVKKTVPQEPSVAAPVKAKASAPKAAKKVTDVIPDAIQETDDSEVSAGKAGLLVASNYSTPKKVMSKEEMDIDMSWARLFNAYLKRDLKQAADMVAALTKLLKK